MSVLFLDTSALLKIFLPEIGSSWIQNKIVGNQIVISKLALYECVTTLRRRYLEGSLTLNQASALYVRIETESQNYEVILLRSDNQLERVVDIAFNLPTNLRLRALDSIHLAAAHIVREIANSQTPPESFTLVSSDRQLLQVAQAEGFVTENPEDHP